MVLHDGLKQRLQIGAGYGEVGGRRAQLAVGVEHGKLKLRLFGVEIDEQVIDLVEHFLGARIGTVDLVDDDDGLQVGFQGLGEHVAGLGQRAFAGIDQQHDAIDHLQRALDLSAEIAVAGRVHDVDLEVVVKHGGVLGEDGDAALAFEIVGVHDAVHQLLVGAKYAALAQHGVNQRGLSVIDVGDDGDVANSLVQAFLCNLFTGRRASAANRGRSGRSSHMVKPMRMLGAAETGLS